MRVRRSRLLFQSESEVGFYFGPEATKRVFKKLSFVHFTENQGIQELVLEVAEMEYIPQVPGNRPEVGQNDDLRKTVSATLSVLK